MVYDKYIREAHVSENFKRNSKSMGIDNRFLTTKVKALEVEKELLEKKLVSLGKDP